MVRWKSLPREILRLFQWGADPFFQKVCSATTPYIGKKSFFVNYRKWPSILTAGKPTKITAGKLWAEIGRYDIRYCQFSLGPEDPLCLPLPYQFIEVHRSLWLRLCYRFWPATLQADKPWAEFGKGSMTGCTHLTREITEIGKSFGFVPLFTEYRTAPFFRPGGMEFSRLHPEAGEKIRVICEIRVQKCFLLSALCNFIQTARSSSAAPLGTT